VEKARSEGPFLRSRSSPKVHYGEAVVKRNPRELGQALLAATFGLVVLLGAAGLAVDVGYLRYQRRLQQSAADSAALAGAAEAAAGNATAAARQDASLNGFIHNTNTVTNVNDVSVIVNPAFPFGATTGVQVQVSAVHPTFCMRIFGVNKSTVSTTAVAITNSAKNCVYGLNNFGTDITNSGTLTANVPAPGCGLVADANLHNTGTINAASVSVHGTASGSATNPAAVTGIVQAGDPLYRLTAPGAGGCKANFPPGNDGIINGVNGVTPTPTFTLTPGTYCSGMTISKRANVILKAGTYVITGSLVANGINWNGAGTVTTSGGGVTIYVARGAGQVQINNLAGSAEQISLDAPTNGAYTGILFYQDPGNALAATIDGKSVSTLQGALFFSAATLNLSNINAAAYTITVARSLAFSGNVNLGRSDYSSLTGGSPIKNAVLVE
jgi:hypothetical protein